MAATDNLSIWNKVARPPKEALKQITGGRLSGMTDVNPQWRYKAMTEIFGPCGIGWYYEITKLWKEPGPDGVVMAFAAVNLWTAIEGSKPIPGIGGSAMVAQEKSGLRANDEAYKMAVTDALSVAMKALGVAADIYAGLWDGSKYRDAPAPSGSAAAVMQDDFDKLPQDRKSIILDTATQITDHMNEDRVYDAFALAASVEEHEKTALWAKLSSKHRAGLKAFAKSAQDKREVAEQI